MSPAQRNSHVDLMRYDASGNLRWKQHTTWNPDSFYVAPHSNRVTQIVKGTGATDSIAHELDGSRRSEWSAYTATRAYFYDGRGRTSGIRSWVQLPGLDWQFIGNPENCGYDPLGRPFRACASAAPLLAFDGDNIVRAQNWSLVQGPGLDDPLVSLLHPDTGGEFELFYVTDGNGRHYAVGDKDGLLDLAFLASDMYAGWDATGAASESSTFNAGRLENPAAPGLSFFRNRVYDQSTGRWTQEDPIGVAGGVNLYQFNGNDPVAYTDPFGLCPDPTDPTCPRKGVLSISVGGSGGVGIIGANFQAGVAISTSGDAMAYFNGGPSAAVGVMAGAQIAAQHGNFNDVIAPTGEGGGVSLNVAPGVNRPSGGVILGDDGAPVGGASGMKGGLGVSLDVSNGAVSTGTVNLVDAARRAASFVKTAVIDFFTAPLQP